MGELKGRPYIRRSTRHRLRTRECPSSDQIQYWCLKFRRDVADGKRPWGIGTTVTCVPVKLRIRNEITIPFFPLLLHNQRKIPEQEVGSRIIHDSSSRNFAVALRDRRRNQLNNQDSCSNQTPFYGHAIRIWHPVRYNRPGEWPHSFCRAIHDYNDTISYAYP